MPIILHTSIEILNFFKSEINELISEFESIYYRIKQININIFNICFHFYRPKLC